MLEKYVNKGTWTESLHIFLYVELIMKNTVTDRLSIEQYQSFELKDTDIESYNKWIEGGCSSVEKLTIWLDKMSKSVEMFRSSFGKQFKPKVVMWSDRCKTSYYKEKLQASSEFESYIESFFRENYGLELGQYLTPDGQYYKGENELGIEIKNDMLIKKYGNIYIEYAEKSRSTNAIFIPSGILKEDNSKYFLIGDRDKFWVFKKKRLIEIYREEEVLRKQGRPSERGISFKEKPTSKGFVYPVKNAEQEAISIELLVKEIRSNK